MKKVLLFGIPIVIAAFLIVAYTAPSFGWGRYHSSDQSDFLSYKFDKMSKELNLDAAQQAKLDSFKNDLTSMMEKRYANRQEMRNAIATEFAKDNPDISKITPLIDQQIDQRALAAHDMVSKVADFYNNLSPQQKKLLGDQFLLRIQEH